MSIAEPTLFSLARAAAVSLGTLVVLLIAGPGVQSWSRKARGFTFWIGMAALLAPGFAAALLSYENFVQQPGSLDVKYCVLIFGRYIQIALLALWLFPPGMSDEALHMLRLSGRPIWKREPRAWSRGLLVACALVFTLVFQEFEIASTWNMRAWPVAIFDAQAGGLALRESLRLALLPFAIQAALFGFLLLVRRPESAPSPQEFKMISRSALLFFPSLTGWCVFAFYPMLLIGKGVPLLFEAHSPLALTPWREIFNTLILAAAATLVAWLLAGWIERRRGMSRLLTLPGLLGPLLCGLLLLAVMQVPPLHLLRDTVFPAVLGLALTLLPYALLLRLGIETIRDRAALHTARASGARRAVWQLDGWPRLCAVLMLFCFGYGDFTINSLLAPPQFASVGARLLNLLHYGRSHALMVMFTLAFAVPLAVALLTALTAQLYPRRRAS